MMDFNFEKTACDGGLYHLNQDGLINPNSLGLSW